MKKHLSSQTGFSLVELMIVVAIIGVLATIGIPTFRTMVQKAKKSEAKVALGGIYTSEVAFFSEYGAYGNRIDKVGFDLDGTSATRIYVVGFPDNACANPAAILPAIASTPGVALNTAFPDYYAAAAPVYTFTAGKMPGACQPGTVANDGSTFTATASGLISPKLAAGDVNFDGWTIDNNRLLQNIKDGTK